MDVASVLIFILLFGLSAFFSGSETAFMSLPQHKIDAFLKQKRRGAIALNNIKKRNERLIITLLIGNNLVNVSAASLATKISIDIASAAGFEQNIAIGASTGIITILLLLFGEIFPKTVAIYHAEKIALYTARLYEILLRILFPVVYLIEILVKKFQKHNATKTITDEDVDAFLAMTHKAGTFETEQYKAVKNTIDFYETTAEEIMVSRTKIEAIEDTMSVQEAIVSSSVFSHSRIPVYHEIIDNVHHFVTIKDLLLRHHQGNHDKKLADLPLRSILKIPLTQPIHKILTQFKKNRKQVAIVVDEYGGTSGLLTVEDIVEEVFGDICDETDTEIEPIQAYDGYYLVQGDVRIDDVLDVFDIDPDSVVVSENDVSIDELLGETVAYCITTLLERFPQIDDTATILIHQPKEDGSIVEKKLIFSSITLDEKIGEVKVYMQ